MYSSLWSRTDTKSLAFANNNLRKGDIGEYDVVLDHIYNHLSIYTNSKNSRGTNDFAMAIAKFNFDWTLNQTQ